MKNPDEFEELLRDMREAPAPWSREKTREVLHSAARRYHRSVALLRAGTLLTVGVVAVAAVVALRPSSPRSPNLRADADGGVTVDAVAPPPEASFAHSPTPQIPIPNVPDAPSSATTERPLVALIAEADVLHDTGQTRAAIELLRPVVEQRQEDPLAARAALRCGNWYEELRQFSEAEELYTRAVTLARGDPRAQEARDALARVRQKMVDGG